MNSPENRPVTWGDVPALLFVTLGAVLMTGYLAFVAWLVTK